MNADQTPLSLGSATSSRRFRLTVVGGACCSPRWPPPAPWSPAPTASTPPTASSYEYERPHITITASAQGLAVPSEVPGGLVDITLESERRRSGRRREVGHHLVIARLDDGVTLDERAGC